MTNQNIYDLVNFVLRKNGVSEPLTGDRFEILLQQENRNYFKKLVPIYMHDQKTCDSMSPFEVRTQVSTLTTTTTTITLPTDYSHFVAMYYTDTDGVVRAFDLVTDEQWDMRCRNRLSVPSVKNPICKIVGNYIYVLPVFDGITYSDWFLPSRGELNAMYDNLHVYGVGGFVSSSVALSRYWSSHNILSSGIFYNFADDSTSTYFKSSSENVRACRTFTASIGAYSLRDEGPAGGLIFYIDGTTYYEAAPYDQAKTIWSNVSTAVVGTSVNIGTGANNTALIIAQIGHTTSAAKTCNDLVIIN